jgi:hypothetical protein
MTVAGVYPFSTSDGKAVPVDIASPVGLVAWDFVLATPLAITIPAGYETAWAYATATCVLKLGVGALPTALVDGTNYPASILIPAYTMITLLLVPGSAAILGLESGGSLYINAIEQWAALAHQRQVSIG